MGQSFGVTRSGLIEPVPNKLQRLVTAFKGFDLPRSRGSGAPRLLSTSTIRSVARAAPAGGTGSRGVALRHRESPVRCLLFILLLFAPHIGGRFVRKRCRDKTGCVSSSRAATEQITFTVRLGQSCTHTANGRGLVGGFAANRVSPPPL